MTKQRTFTTGKILAPLTQFTLPILLAMILQAMYGAVDLLVIGQFGTAADVSAVSTGSQIMQTITSIMTGLAMGATILLGQKIGQGDMCAASDTVGTSITLFSIIGLFITLAMVAATRPIVTIMHAPAEAFEPTVDYVRICSIGALLIMAYNVLGSVFRGMGDSNTPLIAVAIACAANIVLDLLLVAVFHMGTAGAALATVLAQGISVVLSILIIKRHGLPFSLTRAHLKLRKALALRTLRLGIPVALQDLLVSISFLAIIAIVNSLGVIASAGVGVAEKLCAFIMLIPSAYMQSMSAFVAQNIGAGNEARARKAMLYGMITSFGISLVMAYFSFFHGDVLAGIFAKDGEVIAAAADYLRAYSIDTLLVSFLFCFIGYFNGCGKTAFVMLQGIIGAFCVRIPVSYIASRAANVSLFNIGLATPCSTILQIAICAVYFIIIHRKNAAARPALTP